MINLRYHIVSITAVFLALGIGITMGSTFLGKATVDQIDKNVRSAREEVRQVREENAALREQVELDAERSEDLAEQGVQRLLDDRLPEVPVLALAAAGVDAGSLDRLQEGLTAAGPGYEGTLIAKEKLSLTDEGAAEELAELLDASSTDPAQLRRLVTNRLADVLVTASEPPPDDEDAAGTTTTSRPGGTIPGDTVPGEETPTSDTTTTTSTQPTRDGTPELVADLLEAGFLDYEAAPGGPDADGILRAYGYRYAMVTGPDPDVSDGAFLRPLLDAMTADGPAAVVVASAAVGEDAEAVRMDAIGPLRADDDLAGRISTVDDLEIFSGTAAVVLALEDLGLDIRGHYGVGDGATTQLPPPPS